MRGIFSSKNQKENNDIDIAGSSAFKFEFSLQNSEAPQATAKKKKNKAKKKKKRNTNEIIVDNSNGVNSLPKDGVREDTSSDSEHEQITQEDKSTSISAIANETCLDKQRTDDEILQSTSLKKFTESSIPTCDKKKRKKKKKSAKNKSKPGDSDNDFEHVINEFKSAHMSSYMNIKDSVIVSANPAKDCGDKSYNDNKDIVPQPLRDKSVPHFLSANDPELSEEAKRQAKYGNGKNLVAIGPAKKKDTSWLGSNKQFDSNLTSSSSSRSESHHCSPFTFSFNGIL